ncbi:MAG: HAD family phosphatase [Bacteroidota bacterium]
MKQFKNLIFDIGEVLIHLDFPHTIAEFQKLAVVDFAEIISYSREHKVFDRFETGHLTAQQFRNELKAFFKPNVTDDEINTAWNSVFSAYPEKKFDLLKDLKLRYRTFALSNTNEIHVAAFNREVETKFGVKNFETFFHHAYYSNEMGFRKPEQEIYELVLNKENLIPSETFFVDDLAENVESAKELGIQAYQLTDRNKLHDLLADLKII